MKLTRFLRFFQRTLVPSIAAAGLLLDSQNVSAQSGIVGLDGRSQYIEVGNGVTNLFQPIEILDYPAAGSGSDAGIHLQGNWSNSRGQFSTSTTNTARWTKTLARPGMYSLYLKHSAPPSGKTARLGIYKVQTKSGERNVNVSGANDSAGKWRFSGKFELKENFELNLSSPASLGSNEGFLAGDVKLVEEAATYSNGLHTELVVDNSSSGTQRTGDWSEHGASDCVGDSILASNSNGATFSWPAPIPRAGYYTVYARWPAESPANTPIATTVTYRIRQTSGVATVEVNPSSAPGPWIALGTYRFAGAADEGVTVVAPAGTPKTLADAIRYSAAPFDLAGPMTIEAWVKFNTLTNKWSPIVTKGAAWGLSIFDDTKTLTFYSGENGGINHLASSTELKTNAWYHIAAVIDGSHKSLFVSPADADDEVGDQFTVNSTTPLLSHPEPLRFGRNDSLLAKTNYLDGRFDRVRLWSIARTPEELRTNRRSHVRGTEVGLLGEWRFDTAPPNAGENIVFVDPGNAPARATLKGATWSDDNSRTNQPPIDGALALIFRPQGIAYLELTNAAFKGLSADSFSVETWLWLDPVAPAGEMSIASQGDDAWTFGINNAGRLHVTLSMESGGDVITTNLTPLATGSWHHVAAVVGKSATSGNSGKTISLFIDGAKVTTTTNEATFKTTGTNSLLLAARPKTSGRDQSFIGRLDEVRIWNRALSDTWIQQHYSQTFNSGLGLLGAWHFDEGSGNNAMNATEALKRRDGELKNGSDLNRVDGLELNPEDESLRQFALYFNGTTDYVTIGDSSEFQLQDATFEAWLKPEASPSTAGGALRTILMKGDLGYGLALDSQNKLRFWNGLDASSTLASHGSLTVNTWHHVAVVVNSLARTTTFYIDGKLDTNAPVAVLRNNQGPLILGKQGASVPGGYYKGYMDEVRIWNAVRSAAQIASFSDTPLPTSGRNGLIAYYQFSEGQGNQISDTSQNRNLHRGVLTSNSQATAWDFGRSTPTAMAEGVRFQPNPNAVGLWVGTVTLNSVNEVATATPSYAGNQTPTADTASFRILLHVDAEGTVRLLKDVILMAATDTESGLQLNATNALTQIATNPATRIVLVTDDRKLSQFKGLITRGGKKVGIRMGTVGYDFDGDELILAGGLGVGYACSGKIELGRKHPTNPFRHRYHPDHPNSDPRNSPENPAYSPGVPVKGIALTRQINISLQNGTDVDLVIGTYREVVSGLVKTPLICSGTLKMSRITREPALNTNQE